MHEKTRARLANEIREDEQKQLKETADKLLKVIHEVVDSYVLLRDIDGLGRLIGSRLCGFESLKGQRLICRHHASL